MNFNEFLEALDLTELQYIDAIRTSLNRSQVFIKRNPSDVMTNNYNTSIMALHRGNHDIAYCQDPYACGSYILGYLTKNETMISRLLRQVDEDAKKQNWPMDKRLKTFAKVLTNHREVGLPESDTRLIGLKMVEKSRIVKFINIGRPQRRDRLMKGNIQEKLQSGILKNTDSPFENSIHDYYANRPDELKDLCLAEFVANYDIESKCRPTEGEEDYDCDEILDADLEHLPENTQDNHENTPQEIDTQNQENNNESLSDVETAQLPETAPYITENNRESKNKKTETKKWNGIYSKKTKRSNTSILL